uniref:Formin-like protein n=1 Tax=Setaria italica TaxID=4555 RepID=K3YPV0_SETIT
MALFRKFFYKKPPDGLLLITDNIYVFDHCFSMKEMEEDHFEAHIRGIAGDLLENFRDHSFMISNFGTRKEESPIYHILSDYGMTVLDYPGHYEGCPLLTMEMIHCILKSSESWLSLGQHNLLLMHCEQGSWPVLAFMLAALLIYLGHYSNEQKTLDMLYKQSSLELLEMFSPLNPMPSQIRYLRYISTRNVMPEWPPADRALTLDCVILRMVPNFQGQGGFRPIFRIYGPDPLMPPDQTPKVLFSTPKKSNLVRFYSQADELVKINLQCHVQGDVVLECINLYEDLDREEMIFRIMFNTAFIRSNILMLNRDHVDMLWNAKDQFPKDFRFEVIFSDMDAVTSHVTTEPVIHQEKQGLGVEEFAKVLDIFNHLDWLDGKRDTVPHTTQLKISAVTDEPETFFDTREELESEILHGQINSSTVVLKLGSEFGMLVSTEPRHIRLDSSSANAQSKSQTTALSPSRTQPTTALLSPSKVKIPKTTASSRELAPEIDISELESLFSVMMPNMEAKRQRQHPSVATKQEKVLLIDLQRSKNCEIMLRNIKMPLPDLMGSVLALDDSIVDGDQVDYLIKFCPTKEEMELLKGYTGKKENLGNCEQFFMEMMKVPRVESKLRILSFKIKFVTQVADLKNSLSTINSVAEEVRSSVKLKRVMQTILSLGNALNQGTARGAAVGFRLDSLLKLSDIRARNNRMTLMHYLCKVLSDKLPEVLDFNTDLAHLEPASKIQLKELAEEMQAITKGLEKVEQELATSEKDPPETEIFYRKLKEFLADAQAEGRSLALLYSTAGKSADSLAHYFGEDPVRCPFEQVVSTLLSFVKTFERAHAENVKQMELEKKRAQAEAEKEKAKLGAHKKGESPKPGVPDR